MAKTRVKFNSKKLSAEMFNRVADIQTQRLIDYAEKELVEIVNSHVFQNDTMNLQDSYCWVVYYKGKKAKHGFYGNKAAGSKSVLHTFSPSIAEDVNGRALARKFVATYKPTETQGWEIVFAAVAPYGAYLEGGFMFHGKRYQFDVMSQRYDHIKNALSPLCKVTIEINAPRY